LSGTAGSVPDFRVLLVWGLALLLCGWVYSPGLDGPAFLDDAVNLRVLDKLDERPELIFDVVKGNASGPLGRPLSMFSFGLERIYLDRGLRGTKQTNLVLHLLTGSVLLLLTLSLCRGLRLANPAIAALAVSTLWLFSPMFVSTVLYTVQRMAQLATLFSLLALWCYCQGRSELGRPLRTASWLLAGVICLVLAVLSKENALLVVPLVLLLEAQVFRYRANSAAASARLRQLHLAVLALGVTVVIGVLIYEPGYILNGYLSRDFTLTERLLTQLRILWSYVWQLLWPHADVLGLYQDDQQVSDSLLSPLSTLWAMVGWLLLVVAVFWARSKPALRGIALGVAFFLVAQVMESTVFPLELYFEHRNYLPAVGIFLALVCALAALLDRAPWLRNWVGLGLVLLLGRGLAVIASEAQIWSSQYVFHLTALGRHPDSVRANAEMSRVMALGGDAEEALAYYAWVRELESGAELRHRLRELLLLCYAGPAIPAQAINELSATVEDFSDDEMSEVVHLLVKEILDGKCPDTNLAALAARMLDLTRIPAPERISPKLYVSLAMLENHLQNYPQALAYVNALLDRSPGDKQALMMRMYFASALQLEDQREDSIRQLQEIEARGLLSEEEQYNLRLFSVERGG
jgi:hypothetical protein